MSDHGDQRTHGLRAGAWARGEDWAQDAPGLPPPAYVTSGPHLSGFRVSLGYTTLKDAQAAHSALVSVHHPGAAEARAEWRLDGLFDWLTNTGERYPAYCALARDRAFASQWARATEMAVRVDWRLVLGSAEPAPTAAEVLVLAWRLEAYYRQHIAESPAP